MLHVDGRGLVNMESTSDRMRLKDKIVANVANAVKSVQELQVLAGSRTVTLGNYDWQCHRLCEHIDHSLLHGLRHVTPGYWKIVTEFTHKDCIKQIKRMTNVTTDLGRGRAWLFMALNEGLLECYLQCYQNNDKLVEGYYVKDALVRDQEKFGVLLTLCSGLETTVFNLDCDVPYLDLCVYPPKSRNTPNLEATVEFDRLSVCSMESVHLHTKPLPQTVFETTESVRGMDAVSVSSDESGRRNSISADSGIHSEVNYRQRSITPIETDHLSHHVDVNDQSELEVIHVTSKRRSNRNKRKKKKSTSVAEIVDFAVSDGKDSTDGPVIKIPPLDEKTLISAIKISQNNNIPEETSDFVSDMDSSWVSEVRCPGDGLDNLLDQSNLSKSLTIDQSVNPMQSSHSVIQTDNHKANDKSSGVCRDVNRDSGVFTEIIKAKVLDITKETEITQNSHSQKKEKKDKKDSMKSDHRKESDKSGQKNEEPKSKDSEDFESFSKTRKAMEIYNGRSVDDDEEEEKTKTISRDKRQDVGVEESSIYGSHKTHDSGDMDSDEDLEIQETLKPKTGPTDKHKTKDAGKINASSELNKGSVIRSKSIDEWKSLSSKNFSPNPDQKRCQSDIDYLSNSAIGHSLDGLNLNRSVSANHMSHKTSASRVSSNSVSPHKETHSLSGERGRAESTDSDVQVSEHILQAKVDELITQRKLHHYTHLMFGQDEDEEEKRKPEIDVASGSKSSSVLPGEVELDNNTRLYLMLDIVEGDETFVRMFSCNQGHTEGKVSQIYVLLLTNTLYLLHHKEGTNRFSKVQEIRYIDIDFVSLGFDSQILQIACKHKRQTVWLTPGDERVTKALVESLAKCMQESDHCPGRLEVDTNHLVQKIALNKYMARECACEPSEVELVSYSLVHWEDPQSDLGSCEWDRHGNLYYKSNETTNILGTQTWRLAYAVLQDIMLCLYQDKGDDKPLHFLSLKDGQCVGCKRDFNSDRHHSIRVMMADGTFWSISLESETEANKWIQSLCQAIAEGLKMNPSKRTCIACSMVLSPRKVFMVHEDHDTNFIRTLGSARLEDITSILTDNLDKTFLILAFDSMDQSVSSEKWVLYFSSDHELVRFSRSLSKCWAQYFQVDLPSVTLENFSLQKRCREMSNHLRDSSSLS